MIKPNVAWRKLGDVSEVKSGGTPLVSDRRFWDGDIPWYSSGELNDDQTTDPKRYISDQGLANSNAKVFPRGSLLIGMYDTAALKMSVLDRDATFNQAVAGVKPAPGIDMMYLLRAITHVKPEILALRRGVRQKNLSLEKIKNIEIPVPPLPEQRRIVDLLDGAFAGIATAKANTVKNLRNARALFESELREVFSQLGEEKLFSDVCQISASLVDPRQKAFIDLSHVGGANIETKTGALIDLKTAREEGLKSGKFVFDDSMVLYSKIRPYLMKVARPDFKGLCSADIYPLFPKPGVLDRDYLFHLLLSPDFTAYAIKGSARAGMPKVNREHLFAYRVCLPSVAIQKRQAAQLDAMANETQRLAALYQQKLAALDALKKSLLHQAFSGGLTENRFASEAAALQSL